MACRHDPDPAFLQRLDTTLGEGRYSLDWDYERGCHVLVWRWRRSGPFRMNVWPNEQDTDTLRRIQASNLHHHALYQAKREREERERKQRIEGPKKDLRGQVVDSVVDIARRDFNPQFGYNAPRIGDRQMGAAERLRREYDDEVLWPRSRTS